MNSVSKNILEETRQLYMKLSEGFLYLGENLHKIFTGELWKGKFDSYDEYIEWVGVSRATDSKLRAIYCHYVLDKGFTDYARLAKISWTNLYSSIDIATTKGWIEEKVKLAERGQLDGKALEAEKRSIKKPNCKHANTYRIKVCKDCGEKWPL